MRTLTAGQEVLYGLDYEVRCRVRIVDGDGTLQNLTTFKGRNWVVGVDWGGDIDAPVADASIELHRAFYDDVVAPLVETSRLNLNAGGSYDPLVALNRAIRIETAIVAQGHEPDSGDWELVFMGRVSSIDWGGDDTVTIVARDQGSVLQDEWIETNAQYGSAVPTDLEDILQDIIDAHSTTAPTLYTPTTPGWMISSAFQVEIQSVMDQLQFLADQLGWYVRYKYDSGTSAYRLTLYSVDRTNTTPDFELSASQYYSIDAAEQAIDDIRNAVEVKYPSGSDASGTIYATVTRSDATSETEYGRRWCSIQEASTSLIDTQTEAEDLGDAILSDLKDPKVTQVVSMPYIHYVEIGDLIRFAGNGETHSGDLDLAVVGYRHRIDESGWTTELSCNGSTPKGGHQRWMDRMSGPGQGYLSRDEGPALEDPTATDQGGSVRVKVGLPGDRNADEIEWHVGTSSGFTPDTTASSTTFLSRGKSTELVITADEDRFPVDTTFYVKACTVDHKRNRGAFTAAVTCKVKTIGSSFFSSEVRFGGMVGSTFGARSKGSDYPPDGWTISTGTWATDADVTS
jgi:hypothetical protein